MLPSLSEVPERHELAAWPVHAPQSLAEEHRLARRVQVVPPDFLQGQIALGLARAQVTSSTPKDRNPSRHLDDILQEYKDRAAEGSRTKAV